MKNNYNEKLAEIFTRLESSEQGLSSKEAKQRINKYGLNIYKADKQKGFLPILISQFKNPITIILLIVVILSYITDEKVNSIVILAMIGLNTVLGFTQEYKAHKSLEKLKKMIRLSSKVFRDGKSENIDSTELVAGDVIMLNKGNVVPADARIISSTGLLLNEGPLTGESIEVEKNEKDKTFNSSLPQDITNYVFQGTSISEGTAKAIITATGSNTILGRSVSESDEDITQSNYVKNLNKFSKILFYFVIAITLLVLAINIYLGRGILQSLVLGISLALGITPETMPLIISIALSTAAYKLSKEKVLIKRISAFEDFGNVDTICTDKTGTMTKGLLEVEGAFDSKGAPSDEVLKMSAICNASNPDTNGAILENTIDTNIWKYAEEKNIKTKNIKISKAWDLDFVSRNIAVLTDDNTLIVKGAFEEIIKLTKISKQDHTNYKDFVMKYESEGNKVIAISTRQYKSEQDLPQDRKDFKDLQFQGVILLKDQPRDNMEFELAKLKHLNIGLKILTGDSAEVTRQICRKVNLEMIDDRIVTGEELEEKLGSSQQEFDEMVEKYNIFARVDPTQKLTIIESLKRQKHVVAYMGDGINDVGALKAADVGIAVNTAVDVAKDSADIIILDTKLTTVAKGVEEGRKIFANTIKFIFSTMSSSFGNVITIVFASMFLKFIPLLPVQVILLDSLSDLQHLAISTDKVDKTMTISPRNWDFKVFIKYVIYWGAISTIFDFFHIIIINHFSTSPEMFRTTWLIESVTTEVLATIALRTHGPFYKSSPSKFMIALSIIPIALMIGLDFIPGASELFGVERPSLIMLLIVLAIVAVYFIVLEVIKKGYFREFWGIGKVTKQ